MTAARYIAGVVASVVLIVFSVGTGKTALGEGVLEIRVTDHQPGIEDFARLDVAVSEVLLHRQGEARNEGWVTVLESGDAVDIVPLKNGKFVRLGQSLITGGRFDAVRVSLGAVSGRLRSGGMAPLETDGSTLRVKLAVEPGSRQSILIDLFVENQTEHEGGSYVVKVRRIEIGELPAAEGGDT